MITADRRRTPSDGFCCGEKLERQDALTLVVFQCNLPSKTKLEFSCREPSCGALEVEEESAQLADEDYAVDANFFDEGYSMAGSTGFKVWTGSRLLLETLAWPKSTDCERLKEIQGRISSGARLLELGSGVGVVGTYLAAMGAEVVLTDLPTLVKEAIVCNISRNEKIMAPVPSSRSDCKCPEWLEPNGVQIGKGWANATPLDWTIPIDEQLSEDMRSNVQYIVASDVVFLASMLNSLLDTVDSIFKASAANSPTFLLSFQRRDANDGEESVSFTTVKGVIAAVEQRGWCIDCLAWRPVTVRKETNGMVTDDQSEVFVFEIKP